MKLIIREQVENRVSNKLYHFTTCEDMQKIMRRGSFSEPSGGSGEYTQYRSTKNRLGNGIYFYFGIPSDDVYMKRGCMIETSLKQNSKILFLDEDACIKFYGRSVLPSEQLNRLIPEVSVDVDYSKNLKEVKQLKNETVVLGKAMNKLYREGSQDVQLFMSLFYAYVVNKTKIQKTKVIKNALQFLDGICFRQESTMDPWVLIYKTSALGELKYLQNQDGRFVEVRDEKAEKEPTSAKQSSFGSFFKKL